jgi:hypothetical protein
MLDGCTFEDNWALVAGGAGLFVLSSSISGPEAGQPNTFRPLYPLPEDSFTPPTAGQGLETNGKVFLLNSVFRNNSASTAGGGAVAITQQTEMLVNNCTFTENVSPQGECAPHLHVSTLMPANESHPDLLSLYVLANPPLTLFPSSLPLARFPGPMYYRIWRSHLWH